MPMIAERCCIYFFIQKRVNKDHFLTSLAPILGNYRNEIQISLLSAGQIAGRLDLRPTAPSVCACR